VGGTYNEAADPNHPNHPTNQLRDHLSKAPIFGDMYGEGGYDKDKFGTAWEDYVLQDLEGYDVSILGGEDNPLEGYDISEIEGMNFDPYRRNALQDVTATSASDQASAEGALARTGGLSASDRMAMASQFNRDKISGRSGALGKYDQMEATNIYNVGAANASAQTDSNRYDAEQANTAAAWNAAQKTEQNKALMAEQQRIHDANTKGSYDSGVSDAARRYKEQQDLYASQFDTWKMKGQFMGGGAPTEGMA
jgi:hypothetical protein